MEANNPQMNSVHFCRLRSNHAEQWTLRTGFPAAANKILGVQLDDICCSLDNCKISLISLTPIDLFYFSFFLNSFSFLKEEIQLKFLQLTHMHQI